MRQLTQNEQKVVDYIRDNPSCSKADVVRHMSEIASRITVLNYINNLEAEKIINCKMDKPNSQIYRLYVDNSNVLVSVLNELNDLKHNFYSLIDNVCEVQKSILESLPSNPPQRFGEPGSLTIPVDFMTCFEIFFDLLIVYDYRLMLLWSSHIRDKDTLDKLALLIFSKMNEIRNKMITKFDPFWPKEIVFMVGKEKKEKKSGLEHWIQLAYRTVELRRNRLITIKNKKEEKDLYSSFPGAEKELRNILDFLKRSSTLNTGEGILIADSQ